MVFAGSPAAILARQQKLAGSARRQLHMSRFTSPVPTQLGANRPQSRSGVQVHSRAADEQSQSQQQPSQKMTEPPSSKQASEQYPQSDEGEIFPAAVLESAEEAAAGGNLTSADSDTAISSAAVPDNVHAQHVANDNLAAVRTSAQGGAVADASSAAVSGADAECNAMSGVGNESVSALIQHAAASVADAYDAATPAALLLSGESKAGPSTAGPVQQGPSHVLPAGNDTQEQYGNEYPWMEATADHTAVSSADTEPAARVVGVEGTMQQPHVSFASGGMTSAGGSKIPMKYLAAAAADRRLVAEEAAAAAAAACAEAERRSKAKTAAAADTAAGAAMQDVAVSWAGSTDVREDIRQAAEQNWAQSNGSSEDVHAAPMLPTSGPSSSLPAFQPPSCTLTELENSKYSMEQGVLDGAQGGVEVVRDYSEGNEQSDVASFANSAASGLGHLLRAQQPWSESSSSPDRTSTSGSAGVRDMSQLEAEVISQPDTEQQLPQQLLSPDQEAGLGGQLPMQLLSAQEQPQHAQHGLLQHHQTKLIADVEEEQQVWQGADQAPSQHDRASYLPLEALSGGASPVDHATGKHLINSLRLSCVCKDIHISLVLCKQHLVQLLCGGTCQTLHFALHFLLPSTTKC